MLIRNASHACAPRRRGLDISMVLAGLLSSGVAVAQPQPKQPSSPPWSDDAAVQYLIEHKVTPMDVERKWDEGIAMVQQRKYVEASDAFGLAYQWSREARILLNLALAEESAGRFGPALRHFRAYTRDPRALPEKIAIIARDHIPVLVPKTARLRVFAPGSSEVFIDNFSMASGELADVDPGDHEVLGYWVQINKMLRKNVHVELGEELRVEFAAPDSEPTSPTNVHPPASTAEERAMPTASTTRWWVSGGFAAGAVAAAGMGLYFTLAAASANSDAGDLGSLLGPGSCAGTPSPLCSALRDKLALRDELRSDSYWAYGAAGVLAISAVTTFVLWPSRASSSSRSVSLAPMTLRGGTGMVVGGAF